MSGRFNDAGDRTLQVHRCRAVNFSPAGIVSLAITPDSSIGSKRHVMLACARNNGDLELWNPKNENWFLERTIPGSADSPIETVLWLHQNDIDSETAEDEDFDTPEERAAYVKSLRDAPPRLITAGLDGRITEWDTISMKPRMIAEVGGGAVWCATPNRTHTRMAIGCEDGHVRLLDIADGRLELLKLFEKSPTRILSAAWHSSGHFLAVGGADSCIRKMDTRTGRTIQRLTTDTVQGEETIVWDLKILHDHTIISGDSMGNVSFWDWKSGTQTQSLQAHGADVLCLTANKAGTKVWTSGVDRKVVQFTLVDVRSAKSKTPANKKNKRKGDGAKQWIISGEKRYHSHDVRALALMEGRPYDALVSGGVDTTLVVSSPLTEFPHLKQYRMPSFPHRPIVQMTKSGSRLMLVRFQDHVQVWRLGRSVPTYTSPNEMPNYAKIDHQREELVLNIKPKCTTSLSAAAISENGQWIAVSDMETVKLFRVEENPGHLRVRKMKEFSATVGTVIPAAHKLCFTPDSLRMIVAGSDSVIYLVDLSQGVAGVFDIVQKFSAHRGDEASEDDEDAMDVDGNDARDSGKIFKKGGREMIATLAVSGDGQWLASGDLLNRIHIFNLDSLKHHATLPVFSALHTTLSFHPSSPTLIVTCTSNEFYLYDCEEARLTDWSREYSQRLPLRWLHRKDIIMGVAFDPRKPAVMIMYGSTHITFIDLEKPVGARNAVISVSQRKLMQHRSRLRERSHRRNQNGGFTSVEAEGDDDALEPELAELERKEYEKRRKAAAREIELATNGKKGGEGLRAGKGQPTDDEETSGHDYNAVIVIESGSEPDDDEDDHLPVSAASPGKNGVEPAKAGTKRSLNGSSTSISPARSLDIEFSGAFQMEHRYGPVMAVEFIGTDELVVVERPVLAIMQGLGVGGYYKHKYGT
ncbi:hypothetical protein PhCBS80983_g00402 [Powellomyces hirtus]|uniref:Uncharacterized protein n=1 Tax=Powellomyces hirtus TaxID=109895 RepID=A0A507EEG9_9FUNG|nr:hypothetical protein PhCBS80983_g00402 [Powellomyces hirtus]